MGYIGATYRMMEKKMETTIMGHIWDILGLYAENGKEHGNYYNGLYSGIYSST